MAGWSYAHLAFSSLHPVKVLSQDVALPGTDFVDLTDLDIQVGAGEAWLLTWWLTWSVPLVGDNIKFSSTIPGTATLLHWGTIGLNSARLTGGETSNINTSANDSRIASYMGVARPDADGVIRMRAGKQADDGGDAHVSRFSFVSAVRVS